MDDISLAAPFYYEGGWPGTNGVTPKKGKDYYQNIMKTFTQDFSTKKIIMKRRGIKF